MLKTNKLIHISARPTFLNLNLNLNSLRLQQPAGSSKRMCVCYTRVFVFFFSMSLISILCSWFAVVIENSSFCTIPPVTFVQAELISSTVFSGVTSPANQKLGLRMTTLHEEQLPLARKHSLDFISDETGEDEDGMKNSGDDKTDESVRNKKNWLQ